MSFPACHPSLPLPHVQAQANEVAAQRQQVEEQYYHALAQLTAERRRTEDMRSMSTMQQSEAAQELQARLEAERQAAAELEVSWQLGGCAALHGRLRPQVCSCLAAKNTGGAAA